MYLAAPALIALIRIVAPVIAPRAQSARIHII